MDLDVSIIDSPPDGAFDRIWKPLVKFNEHQVGNAKSQALAIVLRDPAAKSDVIGGLWGRSLWESLYIDVVFIPAHLRRHGIGSRIMQQAEAVAVRRGCHRIWLDTYSFQGARPCYEQMGYSVFGVIEGPPPAYPHYFLKKTLEKNSCQHVQTTVTAGPPDQS